MRRPAKCEGLYLTTDLFVSRTSAPITWRHIGVDRDGAVPQQLFKALCAVGVPMLAVGRGVRA